MTDLLCELIKRNVLKAKFVPGGVQEYLAERLADIRAMLAERGRPQPRVIFDQGKIFGMLRIARPKIRGD
jgi:hypothetical protein